MAPPARRRALLGLVLLGACAGTAPVPVPTPAATRDGLVRALAADDPQAAYALLDPSLRAQLDLAGFRRMWQDTPAERGALLDELRRSDQAPRAWARVTLANGERVTLELEPDGWHVAAGVLDSATLATPADTVQALHRALRRQSLPGLLRLLAREHRAAWQAAFENSMDATADPADLQVEIHGDEALVRTTGGGSILLRLEAGEWHVMDVR